MDDGGLGAVNDDDGGGGGGGDVLMFTHYEENRLLDRDFTFIGKCSKGEEGFL